MESRLSQGEERNQFNIGLRLALEAYHRVEQV